jgi:hypothetical protein
MSRYRLALLTALTIICAGAAGCSDATAPNPGPEPQLSETQGGNNRIARFQPASETQGGNN